MSKSTPSSRVKLDDPELNRLSQSPPVENDDEDLDHVCSNLGQQKIRRIPVLDRNKQLVGASRDKSSWSRQ